MHLIHHCALTFKLRQKFSMVIAAGKLPSLLLLNKIDAVDIAQEGTI